MPLDHERLSPLSPTWQHHHLQHPDDWELVLQGKAGAILTWL